MADEPRIATLDIAEIDRWLSNPDASLDELRKQYPFLSSDAEARHMLQGLRRGLADIEAGRVVPHEHIVRDMEERRRRHRPSAAE
jgi:hypothetical protein